LGLHSDSDQPAKLDIRFEMCDMRVASISEEVELIGPHVFQALSISPLMRNFLVPRAAQYAGGRALPSDKESGNDRIR